jgi:hypothetical protein
MWLTPQSAMNCWTDDSSFRMMYGRLYCKELVALSYLSVSTSPSGEFQLNQQRHITEQFTQAIDQLGSNKVSVRVGGIYALGRIAKDSSKDHEPLVETLAAFIREQSAEITRRSTKQDVPTEKMPRLPAEPG